jgi:hypothetical protein
LIGFVRMIGAVPPCTTTSGVNSIKIQVPQSQCKRLTELSPRPVAYAVDKVRHNSPKPRQHWAGGACFKNRHPLLLGGGGLGAIRTSSRCGSDQALQVQDNAQAVRRAAAEKVVKLHRCQSLLSPWPGSC